MYSRSKKASLNIICSALYEVVAFICGLILPRLILVYYGSTYNGVVSSISQFLTFINILYIGIDGASRVSLYKAFADNDNKKISALLKATENYMHKVAMALLVAIAVMACVYPFVLDSSLDNITVSLLVIVVGLGSFGQYFFGITYQILLKADQSIYIYKIIQMVQTILNVVVAVILMVSGCSIIVVKLGSALVFLLAPFLLRVIVRRRYSIDKTVPADKSALKDRWNVMWHSVANIIHDKTDIVVLTLFADIKIVSVYTVYYLVLNGLSSIYKIFTSGLEGGFGNMFAKGEIDNVNRNLDIYEYLIFCFCTVVFSCTFVLILPFVELYTKGVNDVEYIVPAFAVIAVLAQAFMCIRQPYITIVQAAGCYKETKNGAFLEAFLNISISLLLTKRYGLIGVTIGTLVANVFRTVQYVYFLKKDLLHRPLRKFVSMLIWATINTLICVFICNEVLSFLSMGNWFKWACCGIICFSICALITIISSVLFCRPKFTSSLKVFQRMLKRG